MNITVFGGSAPHPGDPAYQDAYRLGQSLAISHHTIMTGGYIGIMEAVSRGAMESGGHTIGMTCDEIEAWRPVKPNAWLLEERRFPTIRERQTALIQSCQAAIALPGGIGTLAEVTEMWSHLHTGVITPRPLILVGAGWRSSMAAFMHAFNRYISEPYWQLLKFAPGIDEAVAHINDLAS